VQQASPDIPGIMLQVVSLGGTDALIFIKSG
jgi:hypothetical protein